MTREEAKDILRLYRPGDSDSADGQVTEALDQMKQDPELRQWFERSCAFHEAMREKLRHIPVPADLKI